MDLLRDCVHRSIEEKLAIHQNLSMEHCECPLNLSEHCLIPSRWLRRTCFLNMQATIFVKTNAVDFNVPSMWPHSRVHSEFIADLNVGFDGFDVGFDIGFNVTNVHRIHPHEKETINCCVSPVWCVPMHDPDMASWFLSTHLHATIVHWRIFASFGNVIGMILQI